jgi:hypothetical protein
MPAFPEADLADDKGLRVLCLSVLKKDSVSGKNRFVVKVNIIHIDIIFLINKPIFVILLY